MNHWFFYFVLHSEYETKHSQMNFLLENESIFSDALLVTQDVLKKLEECSEIKGIQKEVGTESYLLVSCSQGTRSTSKIGQKYENAKSPRVSIFSNYFF